MCSPSAKKFKNRDLHFLAPSATVPVILSLFIAAHSLRRQDCLASRAAFFQSPALPVHSLTTKPRRLAAPTTRAIYRQTGKNNTCIARRQSLIPDFSLVTCATLLPRAASSHTGEIPLIPNSAAPSVSVTRPPGELRRPVQLCVHARGNGLRGLSLPPSNHHLRCNGRSRAPEPKYVTVQPAAGDQRNNRIWTFEQYILSP